MAFKFTEEQKKSIFRPGMSRDTYETALEVQDELGDQRDSETEEPKAEREKEEEEEDRGFSLRETGDYRTIVDFNLNESEWDRDRDAGGYMDHVTEAVDQYRAAMMQETYLPEQGIRLDRAEIRSLAKNQAANVINACKEYEQDVKPWTPRGHRKMAAIQLLHQAVNKQSRLMADDLSEYVMSEEAVQKGAVSYEDMVLSVQEKELNTLPRETAVRIVDEENTDMSADDDGRKKRTGRQLRQEQLYSTDEENKENTQERKTKSENVKKNEHRFSGLIRSLGKEGSTLLPFNPVAAARSDGVADRDGLQEYSEFSRMMGENREGFELRMSDKALNQINTIRLMGVIAGVEDFRDLVKNENLLFKYHKRGRRIAVESVALKEPASASGAYSGFLSKPEFESLVETLQVGQDSGKSILDTLRELDANLSSEMHASDPNVRKKVHRLFAALTIWLRNGRNADQIPDRIFS